MKRINLKIFLIFIPFLSLLFLSFFDDFSIENEITTINKEIEEQGLKWKAGVTSMSLLSPEERRLRLGALVPPYPDYEKLIRIEAKLAAPTQLDWRNKNGVNWLTPIKDQGQCGSCWAFSAIGTVESIYKIERNSFSLQPNLSEQDLVSCSNTGSCSGGYPSKALDFMKREGVVSEDCFPYVTKDVQCSRCSNWYYKLAKIKDWGWVTLNTADKNSVINAIQDGPLSAYMEVYSDFYHYTGGIYEPTPSATKEGGHAVVLIGYNSYENYWICKNSWGEDWGEKGYFRIRMGVCEIGTWVLKAWGVSISGRPPVLSPIPSPTIKEDEELLIQLQGSDPDGDTLIFKATTLPPGATLDEKNGTFKWKPSYKEAGEYWIRFSASDGFFEDYKDVKITVINVKRGKGKI
ncbi:MAG: C1 family peptidase [Candidatus Aminicenantia bacterium]